MKEIIVININKDYCFGCTQTTCSGTIYDFLSCCIEDKEYKKEQVPENFEELKELCKDIKNISIYDNRIEIKINNNDYLYLHKNGHIYCMNEDSNISIGYDRTPQQMWAIIKNLIGEE